MMKNFGKLQLNPLNIKIIAYIKERPCLWDRNNLLSRNNGMKMKEWSKLATQTQLTIDEVKQKWENIRRCFRQRILKMKTENLTECNWPYFPFLLFLVKLVDESMVNKIEPEEHYKEMYGVDSFDVDPNDIVLETNSPRRPLNDHTYEETVIKSEPELSMDENLEEIEATYLNEDELLLNDDPIMQSIEYGSSSNTKTVAKKPRLKEGKTESDMLFLLSFVDVLKSFESQKQLPLRIRIIQTLNSEQLNYEQIDSVEMNDIEYPRDCEAIFLASLYPYLKIVPDYRKLTVRSKITDLFNNEIEPEFTAIEEYIEN